MNPRTKRWIKLNTKTSGIIGHKTDDKPYKNVMTVEQQKAQSNYISYEALINTKIKIDPKYIKRYILCDCGHYSKDHYISEGYCDKCGCTWYHPNIKWLERQRLNKVIKENQRGK